MQRSIQAGIAARIGKYSDAVEVTDSQGMRTLYVSGTPGLDAQTGHVPEDFAAQADLAWRNLEAILAAADMSVDDIVKLTQTLTRRDDVAGYRDIRERHLGAHRPASMLSFVSGLVWPQMLIELEAVAVR